MRKSVFLAAAIILVLCATSRAVSIGVSPGKANIEGMYKDGYAEAEFLVSSASQNNIAVNVRAEGEIKDWIRLPDDKTFSVRMGEPKRLSVAIITPADAKSGNYSGRMEFLAEESGGTGIIGTFVKTGVLVPVNVEITGHEIIKCIAGGISVGKTEEGQPLRFSLLLQNKGNVRIKPRIVIDVWDTEMKELIDSAVVEAEEILPTKQSEIRGEAYFPNTENKRYKVSFSIEECNFMEIVDLDVLKKGVLEEKGQILGIKGKDVAKTGEILPIRTEFENTGEARVIAKFIGEVFLEGEKIGAIDSENIYIEAGETIVLLSYYSPKKAGRYTIIGRVEYGEKSTEELSYSFVVQSESNKAKLSLPIIIVYAAILAGTTLLLARIYLFNKKK
ncbi:hypothetical protein JXA85_04610 [Candidatus Woesearchaeota archaeon]|nr:hypothetical protein [Candidatus Woesearchaeota archaeon]